MPFSILCSKIQTDDCIGENSFSIFYTCYYIFESKTFYQSENFIENCKKKNFTGIDFPVFKENLPAIFLAFYVFYKSNPIFLYQCRYYVKKIFFLFISLFTNVILKYSQSEL